LAIHGSARSAGPPPIVVELASASLTVNHRPPILESTMAAVTVTEFDHLVLRCKDIETTIAWYQEHLGLGGVRLDEWRAGDAPFPSLRVNAHTIIDLLPGDQADGRLDHMCLVVAPLDFDALAASGRFEVLDGPDQRYGARGNGTSMYVRDPDGLTVELRYY
jgi:catechol 2,3-dioxygenase-like lactoylglutathione lyase family enzyme